MRILGIDYGNKRVGLALSDETAMLASPLGYLPGGADEQVCQTVLELVQRRQAGAIVVGLPLQLDGRSSPQTERTRRFIAALQRVSPVPVERWDERLTTAQAERVLIEGGVRRRDRREKIDQLAAQLMLQSYLDAKSNAGD